MKILLIVDMQNDFIDGSLGTKEAQAIVPKVVEKIKDWDGDEIWVTLDTHWADYLQTKEGHYLPIEHCIYGTRNHNLHKDVLKAISKKQKEKGIRILYFHKKTFGSIELSENLERTFYLDVEQRKVTIECCGLCTDICVISNILLMKAFAPEVTFICDASCCAGSTPENHKAALQVMKSCHVEVINDYDEFKLD